jgi:hypothetical protein
MAPNSGDLLVDPRGIKVGWPSPFDRAGHMETGLFEIREVALVPFSPPQKFDWHNMH